MNMNIYTDPEPLEVATIVDFQGLLARVSILESEFRILFRSFEVSLADEDQFFNADILKAYRQPSVYFIPKDKDDRGLSCRLLNASSTEWIDGQLHFQRLSGDRTENSILVYYYDFTRQAKSLHSKGSGYLTFLLPA